MFGNRAVFVKPIKSVNYQLIFRSRAALQKNQKNQNRRFITVFCFKKQCFSSGDFSQSKYDGILADNFGDGIKISWKAALIFQEWGKTGIGTGI